MKTNLNYNQNAVLTTKKGDIVGVIQCSAGEHNIESQLIKAIVEYEDVEFVKITKLKGDFEFLDIVEIHTTIINEEDKKYNKIFKVELTTTY